MTGSIRYFPFAPGIPWCIDSDNIIQPQIKPDIFHRILSKASQATIIIQNGSLFESFLSLCFLEVINYLSPQKPCYWSGLSKYYPLLSFQGLSEPATEVLRPNPKYPTPIFLDKDNDIYFNCLSNYKLIKTFENIPKYKNHTSLSSQILNNLTLPWDNNYLPQFRNLPNKEIAQWIKNNKFDIKKPYVCIFPERGWSQYKKISVLGWNANQVKALAALLKQAGINLLCFTDFPGKYYNTSLIIIPNRLDFAIEMIPKAYGIISEEIDWLLIGAMISEGKLIGKKYLPIEFDLRENGSFLGYNREVYVFKNPTPQTVSEKLC